ncbi:MAG: DUF2259 domain-containing protein [Hyphomicrobiales bacterium]
MRRTLPGIALALLMQAVAISAFAGDFAERVILGFSPDGKYFAFEQYGVQDGSGFPYADIFVIDTATDSWVEGSPVRVLLKDEKAEVKWARRDAIAQAATVLKKSLITHPGRVLASNPAFELSADPHAVTVNASRVLTAREPWTFRLEPLAFPATGHCVSFSPEGSAGFRLTAAPPDGEPVEMHADAGLPESRGCPLRYAISDVIVHEPAQGRRVFAVILAGYRVGFEGPDLRYLAVTWQAP